MKDCCQCQLELLQAGQKDGLDDIGMAFGSEGRLGREGVDYIHSLVGCESMRTMITMCFPHIKTLHC